MIQCRTEGRVRRIEISRPEVKNALNDELMSAIADEFDRSEADDSVHLVVLTGAGDTFSAGADLAYMKKIATGGPDANRKDALRLGGLFHRIARFPKPTVARVNGPAIGGGVGMVAACDIAVAADTAFFAFTEVRLGLVPAVISPFCVRRLGASNARRLFLTGERFDAAAAKQYGLVDEIAAPEELDATVDRLTASVTKGGPNALRAAKELIDFVSETPAAEALESNARLISELRASEEAQEGMAAFLGKRPAKWTAD